MQEHVNCKEMGKPTAQPSPSGVSYAQKKPLEKTTCIHQESAAAAPNHAYKIPPREGRHCTKDGSTDGPASSSVVIVLGQEGSQPQHTMICIHVHKSSTLGLVVKKVAICSQQCLISESRHEHHSPIQLWMGILNLN